MNKVIKNKFVMVMLIIAVFIPSVIGVVSYNRDKNGPVDTKNVVSMTMSDYNGNKYEFTKDNADDVSIIQLFLDINSSAEEIAQLPDPLVDKPFYLVVMSNGANSATYQYYFEALSTEAYYVNGDGKAFKITENMTAEFMKSAYASSIYEDSKVPTLTLAGCEEEVKPSLASWFYKNTAEEYALRDSAGLTTDETVSYTVSGNIALSFDIEPDYFFVKVVDKISGQTLFEDAHEEMDSLMFTGAASVAVEVSAKWYESETTGYYGELGYKFDTDIEAPAEFYLGVNEINVGEFVSVTAKNVKDVSKIQFKCEPAIGYTPVFYADGETAYALVPFAIGNGGGTYTMTFTYGGGEQSLAVKVIDKTYKANTYTVSSDKRALYTEEGKDAVKSAFGDILTKGSAVKYFTGDFVKMFEDSQINRFYGRMYTIGETETVFREEGLEYKTAAGVNIPACEKGEVVYVGTTDLTGNTVIIEHGFGLKTMYSHLGSASVTVGQVVEKNQAIGVSGDTGFTNVTGVYFSMFVGDVRVCPYSTWIDGNWKGVPFYTAE